MQLFTKAYQPTLCFKNGHFNTIFTNLWRSWKLPVSYQRQRFSTPDKDFLDLDCSSIHSDKAMVLVHGLEGHAYSPYMKGMVKAANEAGWDALSLNLRGCSGANNAQPVTYHSGKTEDLNTAVEYTLSQDLYKKIAIVGFSLGGNLVLKYAGEQGSGLDERIMSIAAISNPFDLQAVAMNMDKVSNRLYKNRFLKTLKLKASQKLDQYPDLLINKDEVIKARSFYAFDNVFTAPLNGFRDAEDYWKKSSCRHFLRNIHKPALLINAIDDPFIPPYNIPFKKIKNNKNLVALSPKYGGHLGFGKWRLNESLWHEKQVLSFCDWL